MHPNYNLVITQTITLHERERKKEIEGREREGEGREIEISFLLSSNSSICTNFITCQISNTY